MDSNPLWLFAALGSSLLTAQNIEMNRRAGQEGFRLNMWRMGLASIFWLPLALLMPWPAWAGHELFYSAAVFGGVVLIMGFTIQVDLAMKHNGRVAILYMPLKAMAVFLVWQVIDQAARHHVFDYPWKAVGVLACLGVMMAALVTFRRHDISWSCLKAVLPIVVLYTAGDILARLAMGPEDLAHKLIIFLFLTSVTSAVGSVLLLPLRPKRELPLVTRNLVRHGGWAAFGVTLNQVCFLTALILGPGPSYATMVVLLAPVWLCVFHRLTGRRDDASPVAGTIVVAAAIVLMVISA